MAIQQTRSEYLRDVGSNWLIDFLGWQKGLSDCCGARVENESDICINCGKECKVINEPEKENE
jgi:hypothetical protein